MTSSSWDVVLGNSSGFLCASCGTRRLTVTMASVCTQLASNSAFYKLGFLFSRDQLWRRVFSWEVWVLLWVWVRKGKETWLCHQIAPNLEQCLSWATGYRVCFTLGTCVKYISGFQDFFPSCVEAVAVICRNYNDPQPPKIDSYFPGTARKTFRNLEDRRQSWEVCTIHLC